MGVASILAALGVAASWALTGLVRRYAVARQVMDVPNHRSSHTVPTPRGGGLAIAVVAIAGLLAGAALGAVDGRIVVALVGGALATGGIGWMDDHGDVSARGRFAVQIVAAAWGVWWIGGLPSLDLGTRTVSLGPLGFVLAVVGVVWSINLYNFMDGIDGLAGGQSVLAGVIGGGLLLLAGDAPLAYVSLLFAAGSAGFLVWNWAPAKIFLGDVGSGLLGYLFAILALASERRDAVPVLAWILIFGLFVVDATATLLRRMLRGERWYEAHRSHAYQRLVRAGWPHARATGTVLAVNACLGVLALAAVLRGELLLACFAAGLLVMGAYYLAVERLSPM